jgi:hypothetical protein
MKLYLNDKLRSINIVTELETLLNGLTDDSDYSSLFKTISDIKAVDHVIDPVQYFLNYYQIDSGVTLGDGRLSYIKNALYSVKGSEEVLKTLNLLLGIDIKFTYKFPVLNIEDISQLGISNPINFIEKLKDMLECLMYYNKMSITLKNLLIKISGSFNDYIGYSLLGFYETKTLENGTDIKI